MNNDKIHLDPILPKKKKSELPSFFLILFVLAVFFISPIPNYLFSLIPQSVINKIISPFYQYVTLVDSPILLENPQKYADTKPLAVLSHNTGVCFTFNDNTNKKTQDKVKLAKKKEIIAEIIAISIKNKEFTLDKISLDQPKESNMSVICHKFSKKYSLVPDEIKAVYIRPITPFTPDKIIWVTVKTLK